MSNWRVERHYGFGAAQIAIQPEAHRAGQASIAEDFAAFGAEFFEGGVLSTGRRIVGQTPALLLGLLLVTSFVMTLTADHSDVSPVEVVLMDTLPEPFIEDPPIPVIEQARVEPPKPKPIPVEPPKPKVVEPPPPPMLAEKPAPPPPRVEPQLRPKPVAPVMPKIARVEPPPPPVQPERMQRERPQPIDRPRVKIDVARAKPAPAVRPELPRSERMARAPSTPRARTAPSLSAPAAPALDLPRNSPPPKRAFRVAAAQPRGAKPRALPGMAAAPRLADARVPVPAARPSRGQAPRPTSSSTRRAQPRPALAAAALSVPTSSSAPAARAERVARATPQATARRAPRPAAGMARAKVSRPVAAVPAMAARAGRALPNSPQGDRRTQPGVDGVPLGDLSACVTDREEDRLKQAVVAAVKTQKECVSRMGTYRFVETKNLNAFLMWIDQAGGRAVGDRCGELRYALECLEGASQRAAR